MSNRIEREFGGQSCVLMDGRSGVRASIPCEVRAVPGDAPIVEFIASDETLDRTGEVIKADAWDLRAFKTNPVIVDCHDYSTIQRIVGRSPEIGVRGRRLVNQVEFCLDNPLGNMAYKMAKAGFIKSESVGFIPIEWKTGKNASEPKRTYTKCELLEVSLVVVPANPSATIGAALKSGAISRQDMTDVQSHLEFVQARLAGIGKLPTDVQMLTLARTMRDLLAA